MRQSIKCPSLIHGLDSARSRPLELKFSPTAKLYNQFQIVTVCIVIYFVIGLNSSHSWRWRGVLGDAPSSHGAWFITKALTLVWELLFLPYPGDFGIFWEAGLGMSWLLLLAVPLAPLLSWEKPHGPHEFGL